MVEGADDGKSPWTRRKLLLRVFGLGAGDGELEEPKG
jgi:hypothetical protein